MVLYVVFGLTQIRQPIFDFSGDKMFTGGFKGFMLAALLLINSANGYYNILWYGKDAKRATKDVPFAGMSCVPCLLFIYVGLAMVTGGVLPHDEVAGVDRQSFRQHRQILPGVVYKIFMIGGPIMAIITTLNGVFNDVRYPLAQAAKDGWLPKFILKENRFGAPYLIYTYTLIVVLIPIVTDMSIVTITNIFQVITFFMNVTVVYAISRLPKRYPEAWAKNKFHFSNGALYTFCTVSIIIYTVIFVKGIFSIKVSICSSSGYCYACTDTDRNLFDKERWYPYRDFTLGSICKKGGKVRWRQLNVKPGELGLARNDRDVNGTGTDSGNPQYSQYGLMEKLS